jgi:hypothetical protein
MRSITLLKGVPVVTTLPEISCTTNGPPPTINFTDDPSSIEKLDDHFYIAKPFVGQIRFRSGMVARIHRDVNSTRSDNVYL